MLKDYVDYQSVLWVHQRASSKRSHELLTLSKWALASVLRCMALCKAS